MATPKFLAPMLASSGPAKGGVQEWRYERKFDGLRCIVVRDGSDLQLWSRNELSFNRRFPQLIAELKKVPADSFVMDGEIVAFTNAGDTSFSQLQQGGDASVVFVAFDLLMLLGEDIRHLPLLDRVALLSQTISDTEHTAQSQPLAGDETALLAKACNDRWEGLVAKDPESPYKGGRSPQWRKLKCTASQELVVGGWTEPQGARTGFGALLMGYYEGRAFRYAGKVGTGFNAAAISDLAKQLGELSSEHSPFDEVVKEKTVHWVKPHLVANIAFTEWTNDGRLRHPSFQGLRRDKSAGEVVRE